MNQKKWSRRKVLNLMSRAMRTLIIVSIVLAVAVFISLGFASDVAPVRVLILSGQNNHAWEKTTPQLKKILEKTGRFSVEITEHPEQMSAKQMEPYAVVVSDWNAFGNRKKGSAVTEWTTDARIVYLDFVRNGKGHVVVHAGGSSFSDWKQYQRMIGGGGWKLGQTKHGPRHVFLVRTARESHPICEGMGEFYTHDELWNNTGIDKDAIVIAEAFSSKERRGSGRWEPVAAVNRFGDGRNFTLLLGHDVVCMENPGFRALLVRGTEWAATGEATLGVPDALLRTEEDAEALFKRKSLEESKKPSASK